VNYFTLARRCRRLLHCCYPAPFQSQNQLSEERVAMNRLKADDLPSVRGKRCRMVTTTIERDDGRMITRRERRCD
jgi:hypothetical protein